MATTSNTSMTDLMKEMRGMMAANPMLAPQMEQFWKAQDGILREIEDFSQAWFKRRHEAAQSALDTVRDMNGNGADPSAAMQSMMDWQQHSVQRLGEDMLEWAELCSRCAGRMTSAELEASMEGTEEATKRAKSATKSKQATPV